MNIYDYIRCIPMSKTSFKNKFKTVKESFGLELQKNRFFG